MGILSWLFGGQSRRPFLQGDECYDFEIVGESNYQDELEKIVGARTEEGCEHYCQALLVPEPANRYDPNAVYVSIDGLKVGYLSREDAPLYRQQLAQQGVRGPALCDAMIVGGWKRRNSIGSFGVKLDLEWPIRLRMA